METTPLTLATPLSREEAMSLRAGDRIRLFGPVYTARDAAHRLMAESLARGEELPFDPDGQIIYYVGPSLPPPGMALGAAGPTTASRMDPYTPALLERGLVGMIGKGGRSPETVEAIRRHRAVYFAAVGGLGALLGTHVASAEVVAYEHLGTEAVRRLVFEDFPCIVAVDSRGTDLYATGRQQWRSAPAVQGKEHEDG